MFLSDFSHYYQVSGCIRSRSLGRCKVLELAHRKAYPTEWKSIQSSSSKFSVLFDNIIKESQALGGILDQFWETVGKCNDKLKDNSASNFSASER